MPTSPISAATIIPILPAKPDGTADWQSGNRTGAFVFNSSILPDAQWPTEGSPTSKSGKPHFDEVTFLTLADVGARTNALTTGEVDWIGRCDLKTLGMLKRDPHVAIAEYTGYGHYVFPMMVDKPPFDNVDVRTALKYALNREEITKKIFFGHAKAGNDNPIAPGVKFSINPKPQFAYDPEKAKFHLKKAGMSNLKVDLSIAEAAFNGAVDAAVLFQQHAKAAGIDINVIREPDDGYWDNVWLKKAWCGGYWSGWPTCDWMFTTVYATGAAWNETHYANPKFQNSAAGGTQRDRRHEAGWHVCGNAAGFLAQ